MTFNRQAAFDQSTRGIIAQGGPALDGRGSSCAYRTPNGRKCAAGQLISDDKYDGRTMEGKSVSSADVRSAFGMEEKDPNLDFLRALQRAHDKAAAIPVNENSQNAYPGYAPPGRRDRAATDAEFWPRWKENLVEVANVFQLSSFVVYGIPDETSVSYPLRPLVPA